MQHYVALLRGINVGGNKKIEMKKLRSTFEQLGFKNVQTYINSGNILFSTSLKNPNELETLIEKSIAKEYTMTIPVLVRNSSAVKMLVEKAPKDWSNNEEQKTDVPFLWNDVDSKESLELISKNPLVDTLIYLPGAILWHINKKDYTTSGMKKFIGTQVYKKMTARNINTVRKLHLLFTKMIDGE